MISVLFQKYRILFSCFMCFLFCAHHFCFHAELSENANHFAELGEKWFASCARGRYDNQSDIFYWLIHLMMIRTIFWDQHIIGRSQCLWSFVKFLPQEEAILREDGSSFPFKELLWRKRTKGTERNSTLLHLILIATCLDQAAQAGPVGQFWVRQGWKLRVICLFVDLSFLLSMFFLTYLTSL